ncbi:MAG: polymer-forming cytoskeletal protein [Novosphingobium sp.]
MANPTFSILGSDTAIKGNIDSASDLHVDGKIEGDIRCATLVQGETSEINGSVFAESAKLAGLIRGTIEAGELTVLKTARIEGDVCYDSLSIEPGAKVDGRFAARGSAAPASLPNGADKQAYEPYASEDTSGSILPLEAAAS